MGLTTVTVSMLVLYNVILTCTVGTVVGTADDLCQTAHSLSGGFADTVRAMPKYVQRSRQLWPRECMFVLRRI